MNRFYSSLIINTKTFPSSHQVFRPRYNKQYFKRLEVNLEQLDAYLTKRCRGKAYPIPKDFRSKARKLVKLKESHEKALVRDPKGSDIEIVENQLQELEDVLMPFVVRIPNRLSKDVPESDEILDEIRSDFVPENLSKVLSFTKLSYINGCYSKSVIGPNSFYYYGIGAKLQQALNDFFTEELERKGFLQASGLCFTKSAVVEAANSIDVKDYMNDPCRIITESSNLTTIHAVEASRESLVGFVTSLGHRSTNEPLRLLTSGMGYRRGSDWFDSDSKSVSQFGTVHLLTLNSSIETYSTKEYLATKDIIWNLYKKLGLPARLVHCCSDSMLSNEYDAYKIELWLPGEQGWIQASRISHYLDHITVRTGGKRGHIIDSMVYDAQVLISSIIENRQTSTGQFIIPTVVKNHMIALTEGESRLFFSRDSDQKLSTESGPLSPIAKSSININQRRYFSKKSYIYGHSVRAKSRFDSNYAWMGVAAGAFLAFLLDWPEIWIMVVPNWLKPILYDYFFRPVRRVWWNIIYSEGVAKPEDIPFDRLDKSHYDKTLLERKKAKLMETADPTGE